MANDPHRRRIAHLLRRAGFGAGPAELDEWARLGYDEAVERLLAGTAEDWALADRAFEQGYDLLTMDGYRATWLYRMLHTAQPLQEKMALFWHGHFATSAQKVNRPGFIWEQYTLLRRQGLGDFGGLLRAIARDPAMMLFLDLQTSRVGRPNENWGRELLELFTLGIGHYSEADVADAARAFTGWTIPEGEATFVPRRHDAGPKTFLGHSGALTGDDILTILLDHPQTARFLTRKLLRFFLTDAPDPALIERLATVWRDGGYRMTVLLGEVFRAPEFTDEAAVRGLIKSPVELLIGTLKQFGKDRVLPQHVGLLRTMGQDLFAPPTVKGWDGGPAWLSTSTLLQRLNLANAMATQRDERGVALEPLVADLRARSLTDPAAIVDHWLDWLVDGDVTPEARATLVRYMAVGLAGPFALAGRPADAKLRGLLHLILSSPAYQLN